MARDLSGSRPGLPAEELIRLIRIAVAPTPCRPRRRLAGPRTRESVKQTCRLLPEHFLPDDALALLDPNQPVCGHRLEGLHVPQWPPNFHRVGAPRRA